MTPLSKPVTRVTTVIKQGKFIAVTMDENNVLTFRRQRSTFKLRLNIGQAYDYAATLAANELTKLKKQIKKAKKEERFADVIELQQKLKELGK